MLVVEIDYSVYIFTSLPWRSRRLQPQVRVTPRSFEVGLPLAARFMLKTVQIIQSDKKKKINRA